KLSDSGRSALRRTEFGFVFQFGQLVPELTCLENVALPLRLSGASRREAQRRAAGWLDRLEVSDVAGKRPGEVSGGQGQRAAMTAVGVALGVALLLVAASIPAIIPARHVRAEARDFVYIGAPHLNASANTMLVAQANTAYRGTQIRGLLMRPEGARAPVPPG